MANSSAAAAAAAATSNPSANEALILTLPRLQAIARENKVPVILKGTKKEVKRMSKTLNGISFVKIVSTEIVPNQWFKGLNWNLILGGIAGVGCMGCIALCVYRGYTIGIKFQQFLDAWRKMIEASQTLPEDAAAIGMRKLDEAVSKAVDVWMRELMLGSSPYSEGLLM